MKPRFIILLVFISLHVNIFGFEIGGLLYKITSEDKLTVEVTQKDYSGIYQGEIVIPENVKYNNRTYKVTSISSNAFYNCDKMTSITIPKTITSVGKYAFLNCKSLTTVIISCKNVGNWFRDSKVSIKNVILKDGVESVDENVFMNCINLALVRIANSVKSIGAYAFSGCINLDKLTIGNGIKTIGSYAFYNCRKLSTVTLPQSVTYINSSTFRYNTNLRQINIPASRPDLKNAFDSGKREYIKLY